MKWTVSESEKNFGAGASPKSVAMDWAARTLWHVPRITLIIEDSRHVREETCHVHPVSIGKQAAFKALAQGES